MLMHHSFGPGILIALLRSGAKSTGVADAAHKTTAVTGTHITIGDCELAATPMLH